MACTYAILYTSCIHDITVFLSAHKLLTHLSPVYSHAHTNTWPGLRLAKDDMSYDKMYRIRKNFEYKISQISEQQDN